ncbi:MAG: ankyrin repeat domain-containing protein [Candidatus Dependentiae bacterium]|nr:ankyrin repeat domain-containing protein [Candidatus Dependentiae bacterium]
MKNTNTTLITALITFTTLYHQPLHTGATFSSTNTAEKILLKAVKDNNIQAAKQAVKSGANINIADKNGLSPLMLAIKNGNPEMLLTLQALGAQDNQRGLTAAMYAAEQGQTDCLRALLNNKTKKTDAALKLAIQQATLHHKLYHNNPKSIQKLVTLIHCTEMLSKHMLKQNNTLCITTKDGKALHTIIATLPEITHTANTVIIPILQKELMTHAEFPKEACRLIAGYLLEENNYDHETHKIIEACAHKTDEEREQEFEETYQARQLYTRNRYEFDSTLISPTWQ